MSPVVLIVDDAPDVRELVAAVLGRSGFDTREAENGHAALAALRVGNLPDVVVLDVQMPGLDGWDTLAAIRAEDRTAHLPVVMCTVRSQPADTERGWALGCDGFVPKPFAIAHLASEVSAVCARSLAEREEVRLARRMAAREHG